jgi:hypothetical protein
MVGYARMAGRLARSPLVRSLRTGAPAIAVGVPVAYRIVRTAGSCARPPIA